MAWWNTSCDDVRASLPHMSDREMTIAATVLRMEGRSKTMLELIEREQRRRAKRREKSR